ncbi:hypothetical protein UY3_03964 [Chelonia mydas]|uniref:Uncharacterized protein n=1 Tax=Chelonia mydas TaxID=8469 RepID=M7BSX7_CHEMY|nr:hypothetical protein UY3_03964 [Chelonia mydas]
MGSGDCGNCGIATHSATFRKSTLATVSWAAGDRQLLAGRPAIKAVPHPRQCRSKGGNTIQPILISVLLLAVTLPSELGSWTVPATLQLHSSEGSAAASSGTEIAKSFCSPHSYNGITAIRKGGSTIIQTKILFVQKKRLSAYTQVLSIAAYSQHSN